MEIYGGEIVESLNFSAFVDWCFLGVISGGIGFAVFFMAKISSSIAKLNVRIAQLLERTDTHTRELDSQSERIAHLERHRERRPNGSY